MAITLISSIILYSLTTSLVALGAVGAEAPGPSEAPLEAAAQALPYAGNYSCHRECCLYRQAGGLLSQILGISRIFYAMAEGRDLPRIFGRVSEAGVPVVSTITAAASIFTLAMLGTIPVIASTATFSILLYYTVTNISAVKMKKGRDTFPVWISWIGLFGCLFMAVAMDLSVIPQVLGFWQPVFSFATL